MPDRAPPDRYSLGILRVSAVDADTYRLAGRGVAIKRPCAPPLIGGDGYILHLDTERSKAGLHVLDIREAPGRAEHNENNGCRNEAKSQSADGVTWQTVSEGDGDDEHQQDDQPPGTAKRPHELWSGDQQNRSHQRHPGDGKEGLSLTEHLRQENRPGPTHETRKEEGEHKHKPDRQREIPNQTSRAPKIPIAASAGRRARASSAGMKNHSAADRRVTRASLAPGH